MTTLTNEKNLIVKLGQEFESYFSRSPDGIFKAPGRVNLIGEHTDYNDGFVLPVAIDRFTWVAAAKRKDKLVNAVALDIDDSHVTFSLDEKISHETQELWGNYLKGVVKELVQHEYSLSGMDIAISGNVPQGAGLSSSASFEMAIVAAFSSINNFPIDGKNAARIGQAAENDFVGCKCGIMDQLIAALGKEGHAMLLDCRSLDTRLVPIPENCELVIVNSKIKRGLVESEYNTRRQQCEEAAAFFGIKALRDLDLPALEAAQSKLDPIIFKRAKHIVTENRRTLLAADALASKDLPLMGELMAASHVSMRDDFAITVPAIDQLVEIMQGVIGSQGGVRMTGGGFGGCAIGLIPTTMREELIKVVEDEYPTATGLQPEIYVCSASDGGLVSREQTDRASQ